MLATIVGARAPRALRLVAPRAAAIAAHPAPAGRPTSTLARTQAALQLAWRNWPIIAAGAGGLVAVYGLGSGMYHVSSTLLSLDLKQAFEIGLATGMVGCGGLAVAAAVASRRYRTISVNAVQRRALAELSRSAAVLATLGPNVRRGALRAYDISGPRVRRAPGSGAGLALLEPRVRMLLQVAGDRGAGVATVEAVNHQGRVVVTLLALDAPGGGGPAGDGLLLVTGTEEKLHVTGTLRAFLTTERARFIPQDRTLTEEELLREQAALPADAADEDDGDNAATPPPGKPT